MKAADRNVFINGGSSRPARHRQTGHRPRHALADRVHRRHGHGVSGVEAQPADHGRPVDSTPTARTRARPHLRAPERHVARPGRLRQARRGCSASAFDGTPQLGSKLPIVYDEYGVDSQIPDGKRRFYGGREPATTKPVSEGVQAAYYRTALEMAACQPTVRGFLIFHVTDENDYNRWQSGVYYVDGTPKSTRPSSSRR